MLRVARRRVANQSDRLTFIFHDLRDTLSIITRSFAMTIIGVGIDILHVPRIAALVRRRGEVRFAKRVLSDTEVQDWKQGSEGSLRYLAVRYEERSSTVSDLLRKASQIRGQRSCLQGHVSCCAPDVEGAHLLEFRTFAPGSQASASV